LAIHSPVFEALFFGDSAEKEKKEVEIKDVVYEEFLDLLHLIYSRTTDITDRAVPHILKLADRFQVEDLVKASERNLAQSKGIDVLKKLLFADHYRLASLKDHCLNSFTNASDLVDKLKSPEYDNFSDGMKVALCDRMAKLARE
ncbi:hypothetical protein PMAYCL1PPCAC_24982, partial [Pristionchus mayeri]